MNTTQTLTATTTRPIFCRDAWDAQVVIPTGSTVTVEEKRRGWVIRSNDRAGVSSVSTYTWAGLVARVEVP